MPMYWWLNAEVRTGEGWKIPTEFPSTDKKYGRDIGGEFGWLKVDWVASRLFFGAEALFPFARGRPPGASEFCRLWDQHWPGWVTDKEAAGEAVCWLGYEQLYVDLWHDPAVLMRSEMPAPLAKHFGNGTLALPEADLRAAGATDETFTAFRNAARPVSGAIDCVTSWIASRLPKCLPRKA